jgi:hypothetical protein
MFIRRGSLAGVTIVGHTPHFPGLPPARHQLSPALGGFRNSIFTKCLSPSRLQKKNPTCRPISSAFHPAAIRSARAPSRIARKSAYASTVPNHEPRRPGRRLQRFWCLSFAHARSITQARGLDSRRACRRVHTTSSRYPPVNMDDIRSPETPTSAKRARRKIAAVEVLMERDQILGQTFHEFCVPIDDRPLARSDQSNEQQPVISGICSRLDDRQRARLSDAARGFQTYLNFGGTKRGRGFFDAAN